MNPSHFACMGADRRFCPSVGLPACASLSWVFQCSVYLFCASSPNPKAKATPRATSIQPQGTEAWVHSDARPAPALEPLPAPPLIVNPRSQEAITAAAEGCEYLHAELTKVGANHLLLDDGGVKVAGKYLVRQLEPFRTNVNGAYVVSVIFNSKSTHHPVETMDDGTYTINGAATPCITLTELVDFLGEKQKSARWPIPLVHGIKPSPVTNNDPALFPRGMESPISASGTEDHAAPSTEEQEAATKIQAAFKGMAVRKSMRAETVPIIKKKVACAYASANGMCRAVAQPDMLFCVQHTCTMEGCALKKGSREQYCVIHGGK
jgi:hypothetical protein